MTMHDSDWHGAIAGFILAAGTLLVIIAASTVAFGHDAPKYAASRGWPYPSTCCGTHDCQPLSLQQVQVDDKGYYVSIGGNTNIEFFVPYAAANTSPDGRYHWCWKWVSDIEGSRRTLRTSNANNPPPTMNRSLVCFWAPDYGS